MMKTIVQAATICIALAAGLPGVAQKHPNRIFKKGQMDVLFQIGLSSTFLMDDTKVVLPPLGGAFQYRIGRNYSLGLEVAHSVSESTYSSPQEPSRDYKNSFFFVGLRNAFHCDCRRLDNLDVYGGGTVGYNVSIISVLNGSFGPYEAHRGIRPREGKLTYSGFVGVRYACSPSFSLFGEIGYGISLLKVGIGYQI